MSISVSTSSDLLKGKMFLNQLLYVQHVDKEKDTASEIPEPFLQDYLQSGHKMFSYLRVKPNLDVLKSSLKDDIIEEVGVYSNPLPIPLESSITIHAFVI